MKANYLFWAFLPLIFWQCQSEGEQTLSADSTLDRSQNWNVEKPIWGEGNADVAVQGVWEFSETGVQTIAFPTSMQIQKVYVTPGQTVAKGDRIVRVTHPDFISMQTALLNAKEAYSLAKLNFGQWKKVAASGGASTLEWTDAQSKYNAAQATYEGAKAALLAYGVSAESIENQGVVPYLEVTSKFSGTVLALEGYEGSFLAAEKAFTHVVATKKARIRVQLAPSLAHSMYIGQRATWTNANGAKGQGTVRGIAAQSSNDGLISVWIDPSDQPANILDGMFAQIVLSNEMPASWKLPRTSLIRQGEENFVVSFHKSSNELEVLPVTVVSEDHNSVYVSYEGEGFEAQEIVVAYVNRAFALAEEK